MFEWLSGALGLLGLGGEKPFDVTAERQYRAFSRRPKPLQPSELDDAFRRTMRDKADSMHIWRTEMNSMVGALRPDLLDEFKSLYFGPPSNMGTFMDKHFSIAPEGWGFQPITDVPAIFRKRFVKTLD